MSRYFYFLILLFAGACNKPDQPNPGNSSTSLDPGRAGISFTTDTEFGGSKTFNIKNTSLTISTTQTVGSTKRYMVLKAEENYGGLADTRKATIYITVPVTSSLPLTIDLSVPLTSVPSAQLELYNTYGGGLFGNTYRSHSGQLVISKLTSTEIEGSFSGILGGSVAPGYTVSNGTFAGKF